MKTHPSEYSGSHSEISILAWAVCLILLLLLLAGCSQNAPEQAPETSPIPVLSGGDSHWMGPCSAESADGKARRYSVRADQYGVELALAEHEGPSCDDALVQITRARFATPRAANQPLRMARAEVIPMTRGRQIDLEVTLQCNVPNWRPGGMLSSDDCPGIVELPIVQSLQSARLAPPALDAICVANASALGLTTNCLSRY